MSNKGMTRKGIKGKYITEAQRDKILERLRILGPDDKYAPKAVTDEIDYLTGLLRGKGSAGTFRTFKQGGAVKKNKGSIDYRKGGMVMSTIDNRKKQ